MKARRKNAGAPTRSPHKVGDLAEGLIAQTIASIHLSVMQLGHTPKNHKRLDWVKATYEIAGSELTNCLAVLNKYSRQSLRHKHARARETMRETLKTLLGLNVAQAKSTRNKSVIAMAQTLVDALESLHLIMADGAYAQTTINAVSSPTESVQ